MKQFKSFTHFTIAMTLFFLSILLSCNTQENKEAAKPATSDNSTKSEVTKSVPDAVIRFLIDSAARDFNNHQPPTVIDIRNVKAGYISTENETTYLICGELLSREEKDWIPFVTIKTSGYEQYIGENVYCQKATFEATENDILSGELKKQLNAFKK